MKPEAVQRPVTISSVESTCTPRNFSIFEMGLNKADGLEWESIKMHEQTNILLPIDRMIKGFEQTNLRVVIGDHVFNCHLIVLQAFSKYFEKLTPINQVELPQDKVTPVAFELIYDWLLSENPRIQREYFFDTFTAARFLEIDELVEQGWASLSSHSNFSEEKAFAMYLESQAKGDELLMQLMLNRISKTFLPIVASKEFLDFTCKEVVNFLKLNTMAVHSETEILFTAIRWLFHDWGKRKQYLLTILNEVRFVLIHPSLLIVLTAESKSPEVNEIMKNPEVDKRVKSSLEYILSQYVHRDGLQSFELQERFNLDEVDDRLWIVDPEFKKFGKDVHFWPTDYGQFLKYLAILRAKGINYWTEMEYVEVPSFLHSGSLLCDIVESVLNEIQTNPSGLTN